MLPRALRPERSSARVGAAHNGRAAAWLSYGTIRVDESAPVTLLCASTAGRPRARLAFVPLDW